MLCDELHRPPNLLCADCETLFDLDRFPAFLCFCIPDGGMMSD